MLHLMTIKKKRESIFVKNLIGKCDEFRNDARNCHNEFCTFDVGSFLYNLLLSIILMFCIFRMTLGMYE